MELKQAIEIIKEYQERIGNPDFLETLSTLQQEINDESEAIGFREAIAFGVFMRAGQEMFMADE